MLSFYKHIIKPILFRVNPDVVHAGIIPLGEMMGSNPLTRGVISVLYGYHGPDISKTVDGVTYRTPVLLSAGFDPNGRLTRILKSVSFGGEEVGSVTARPSKGNPPPRQIRLKKTKSLIVNKGLANEGVAVISERLAQKKRVDDYVVGVSVARTNGEDTAQLEPAIEDYCTSLRTLAEKNIGDYYTINISCPNTFTGELFITPDNLDLLLQRVKSLQLTKPLYIKMPISIAWEQFHALLKVADVNNIQGVIIGNLQKEYATIPFDDERPSYYRGGLSGVPCREKSNEYIEATKIEYGNRFTIIGCGGILSVGDAMEKFDRGADLVMLITGMIFTGPHLMRDICHAYARRIKEV